MGARTWLVGHELRQPWRTGSAYERAAGVASLPSARAGRDLAVALPSE